MVKDEANLNCLLFKLHKGMTAEVDPKRLGSHTHIYLSIR